MHVSVCLLQWGEVNWCVCVYDVCISIWPDGQIDFYIVKLEIPVFVQHRPVLIFVCLAVSMAPQMPSTIGGWAFSRMNIK